MYRDYLLGELNLDNVGQEVTLSGWVDSIRDHGGLIFVDLRDYSGKTQIVIHPEKESLARKLKPEFVIQIKGEVRKRSKESINPNIPTGEIEVELADVVVLNESLPLPFEIDDDSVGEVLKYKYRYLSLRNQSNYRRMKMRSNMMKVVKDFFHRNNFLEIDTPILTKSTPEGARDFLVPSRMNEGKFYALPQSPQLFKQLLMIGGIDRYFQVCKCFRDEDLRADRQPEFLQIDAEMSFVSQRDVMNFSEELIKSILKNLINYEIGEVPVITYEDAMSRYGSDKPDISFGMLIKDISDIADDCGFKVFSDTVRGGGKVRGIVLNEDVSRKDIDMLTQEVAKFGAKGLAWIKMTAEGPSSVITKFFTQKELSNIVSRFDATVGDTLFFVADDEKVVCESLGHLRLKLADMYNLRNNEFNLLWVINFPMFEKVGNRYKAVHHPFTASTNGVSQAYDLVMNGSEIGGGSIRIHNIEEQLKVFDTLGISREEAEKQFPHLLNALRFGAPPHGGIAFGFSRILSMITEDESIRDVMPFPKTQRGVCLTTDAPSSVSTEDLTELGIRKIGKNNDKG
tara:strand:+ start:111 stop:1817 length:1707 start_codon:yes stop_codon:yes gene_type:complete